MNINSFQNLFPQGVRNFNNLIYNIRSYNKAHFGEEKNYYNDRKSFGKKFLDGAFTLGSTGPLLGGTLGAASGATGIVNGVNLFSKAGLISDFISLTSDVSFSNLYENLVKQSTKKPVIVVDFDKENDSLRDSAGHIVRAFSRNIISKHAEKITEEGILHASTIVFLAISMGNEACEKLQ